jgi:hypothetical protein
MLRAPQDGVLTALPDIAALAAAMDIDLHQSSFSKPPGSKVMAQVLDNSGFIGQIMLRNENYDTLSTHLRVLANAVEEQIRIEAQRTVELI